MGGFGFGGVLEEVAEFRGEDVADLRGGGEELSSWVRVVQAKFCELFMQLVFEFDCVGREVDGVDVGGEGGRSVRRFFAWREQAIGDWGGRRLPVWPRRLWVGNRPDEPHVACGPDSSTHLAYRTGWAAGLGGRELFDVGENLERVEGLGNFDQLAVS